MHTGFLCESKTILLSPGSYNRHFSFCWDHRRLEVVVLTPEATSSAMRSASSSEFPQEDASVYFWFRWDCGKVNKYSSQKPSMLLVLSIVRDIIFYTLLCVCQMFYCIMSGRKRTILEPTLIRNLTSVPFLDFGTPIERFY